ncbi:MAG: hypothetical protein BA862_13095 [Desulfobulbaceae bacterium S3730MH12]|nr:MAG: hypothetical protein BA862_13095 [Desulfobulbaceae bacterium S3730MH12]
MSFENTHLWAADVVKEQIVIDVLRELIVSNIDYYYLGAIFPDTFSYSREKKIRDISSTLHGNTGTLSNQLVFDVLERIKHTGDKKNLAFICGFLTHCAMDIVFHPIIGYFCGYKPQNNDKEAARSSYLHWHYETEIDKRFNNDFYLDRIVKPTAAQDLLVASILNTSEQVISDCLKRQITFFKRFRSLYIYTIYRMLSKTGLVEKKYLGGFYANLKVDSMRIPDNIRYRDIISGEDKETTMDNLMDQGIKMGIKMVESAFDYRSGKISLKLCKNTISGSNLDTGRIDKTMADVKFSVDL